jgi:predicted dehydrogenase
VWNFEEMNTLEYYNCGDPPKQQGFRRIMATDGVHPFVSAWWPPGHILGYEHAFVHAVVELMRKIGGARDTIMPDFRDGAACVAVLDAVAQSAAERAWVGVERVE